MNGPMPRPDGRGLREILDPTGGDGVASEILGLFREDASARLAGLRAGLAALDREAIERAAHGLSGSGGMLRFAQLHEEARALELGARSDPPSRLGERVESVEREVAAALTAVAAAEPARATRVLVVDDEPHIARLVQFVLVGAGYVVQCASSGPEALDAVGRWRPDAVVLDLVMPGMSGLEVLERMCLAGGGPPPTIVLTSRADPATAEQVRLAGAAALCAKPVAPSTLLETLSSVGVVTRGAAPAGPGGGSAGRGDVGLVAEVAAAWEALETLYDVSAVAFGTTDPAVFANALAERFARSTPGLEAALWVDGAVAPASALAGAHAERGLVSRAFAVDGPVVVDGPDLVRVSDLEAPIVGASAALAVALAPGAGVRGALVAWRRQGAIDSRLVRLAESLARQASAWFEAGRVRLAEQEREQLRHELAIGARLQRTLLCAGSPPRLDGLRCATLWKPSLGVAGDFVDFVPLSRRRLDVMVGDVMGKGVQAALLGAATKNHLLRSFSASGAHAAAEILVQEAHERLYPELVALGSFVTLCYARLDALEGTLSLVDAGHTRTLLLREGVCHRLSGHNAPLGFDPRERFQALHLPTRPGDVLLLYTDGVTEARDAAGRTLGEEWLTRWLEAHGGIEPQALVDALGRAVEQWTGGQPQDDVTAACVRVEAGT